MNKLLFPQDVVGGSFWLISLAMIGAAIFFFLERGRLSKKWNTVMTLIGVIALMSSIHYFYAKNLWVMNGQAPIALRYIDWTLTFPLQILTFYVMLSTVTDVKRGMFWRSSEEQLMFQAQFFRLNFLFPFYFSRIDCWYRFANSSFLSQVLVSLF